VETKHKWLEELTEFKDSRGYAKILEIIEDAELEHAQWIRSPDFFAWPPEDAAKTYALMLSAVTSVVKGKQNGEAQKEVIR
jgi:uncharacterized heparinase superfamily protein